MSVLQKIKNILVPLDGSPTSLKGLDLALVFARSLGTKITALNVIRLSGEFQFPVSSEVKQEHARSAEKIISDAQKITKKQNVSFVGKIVKGDSIGKEIIKFSKAKKFDMIVMGSRGPYPSSETFLGSVANYVVHKSKIPVTMVK